MRIRVVVAGVLLSFAGLNDCVVAQQAGGRPAWAAPRTREFTWSYDSSKARKKGDVIPVLIPPLQAPAQEGSFQITGTAQHRSVTIGGNTVLLVTPEEGKSFTITARVSFAPVSYEASLKTAVAKKLPDDVKSYLGDSKGIEPQCVAVQKVLPAIQGKTVGATLRNMSKWVEKNISYEITFPGSAEAVLKAGKGECGGRAMVYVALARAAGIPAREVWGYTPLYFQEGPTADAILAHLRKHGADPAILASKRFLCSHAWAEVYLPGFGWAMVEPTAAWSLGLLPTDRMKMYHFPVDDPDGYLQAAYANIGVTGWIVGYRDVAGKK